ncbi:uncharacterized protein [Watersipora subatra]|uniref:uncharacterized protein n=1 Tax=Watersipora subatra TaxID=2589382 RepID=UPI00355C7A66
MIKSILTEDECGVIMGEPRQLRQLADYWITLKKRLAEANMSQRSRSFRTEVDGILLKGVSSSMQAVHGQYKKNEQWGKVTYVGGGVAGKCYLAVDVNSEAQFAVKKIELLKYQSEELELWSELEHPNLVQLFGACRVKNKIYIFSEFYAAGTLAEFIESQKMLNQWLSLWFLSQLLDSLIYLTKKNILHDDIKADNIFLKPDSYQLGLGDFGLSRKGQCPPNMNPVGGQHHWSPEKARSEGHGFPADLWAAICTLVHMLSGDPPWKRRFEETKWLHYTIGHESPPIQDISENLLTIVDTLIRKAWTVDASERPAAADLLEDECFQIIFDRHDYNDPIFRSHFPVATEEDEEMELDTDESEFYVSVDDLLDGMENKEQAAEYLNMICATLTDQEFDVVPPCAFGSTRTAGSPSASGGTSTAKRQYSIKRPLMESIVEEKDVVNLSEDDSLHLSQNILERREMPAVTPLVLPRRSASPSCLGRRSSWGRSNTSPSPSIFVGSALYSKRDTLRKQETSPAIILSAVPIDDELVGEKDIFDLNPSTSGYQTGSTQMQFSEGPSLAPSDPSLSNLGDVSNVWSQQWLGASSSSHWNGDQSRDFGSNMGEVQSNRMGHIQLDTEYNVTSATMPEKLELSSSLQIFKDSFSSSSVEPKGTLTLVNGLTMIDQIEVSVKGKETWRDIIEQNMSKVKHWNLESYTYYLTTNTDEPGSEVKVNESVPKDKIDVFVYPSQTSSTWHVHNNRITYA